LNKIEFLKSLGFTPISENLGDKLEVKCRNGHVFKREFNTFKKGFNNCPICEKEEKIKFLSELGFISISKDLNNELEVRCEKGHTFRRSLKNLGLWK
jgi:N-acetylglutamate synthase-like GNAT family acetyltransferase